MAEKYVPLPEYDHDTAVQPAAESTENESASIIRIDEYRERIKKREALKKMGHIALAHHTVEDTLSIVPISVDNYPNGDMSVHYAEYREGYPEDNYGIAHSGWSGGPEVKRIVVTQYDSASGSVSAGFLLPRNLRYLESDLRAKRRMPGHDVMVQEATAQLKAAEKEVKMARLEEAEAHCQAESANFQAAEARLHMAQAELQAAYAALQGE